MSLETKHFYEFANFRLDPAERVLLRDGKPLPLTPKVFHLLKLLVENHGHVVEKDLLINEIWANSFVEDGNLAVSAAMLRKSLSDDAAHPIFIETIPRRGYRFIADVKRVADPITTARPEGNVPETTGLKSHYLLVAVPIVSVFLLAVVWFVSDGSSETPAAPLLRESYRSQKLITSRTTLVAAISPDGKFAAYSDEAAGKQSVWLRQLETAENIQIIPPSDDIYFGFAFSHDGNWLYFARKRRADPDHSALYRVRTFGGIPVRITDNVEGWISLSPDDSRISYVRCLYTDDNYCSLLTAEADGSGERELVSYPKPIRISDNQFSPDGRKIAFGAGHSRNGSSEFGLFEIDLASGLVREVGGTKFFNVKSLKWLTGGNSFLFVAKKNLAGRFAIWIMDNGTAEARQVTNDSSDYGEISINKAADKMIAIQVGNDFSVHFGADGRSTMLTPAKDLSFAPDGRILYTANDDNIWIMDTNGGNRRQLTNDPSADFSPRAEPLGRHIYFTSNRTGENHVWRMNIDGTNQVQVTRSEGGYPSIVAPDGKWIYYQSGLRTALWRVSHDGVTEQQVSPSYMTYVSPDASLGAHFSRSGELIKLIRTSDGQTIGTLNCCEEKSLPVRMAWSPDSRSLNFVLNKDGKNTLWQQSLNEGRARLTADFGSDEVRDLAIMPDGRSFAFVRGKWVNDAVLITGLR